MARVEYAYPVYDVHYQEHIKIISDYVSSFENLSLLGRVGAFKYINIDECIEAGLALGRQLLHT